MGNIFLAISWRRINYRKIEGRDNHSNDSIESQTDKFEIDK